jgi:hypothetical protein
MMSPICRDMEKFGGHQSTRRTAAMASLNVGSGLRYQAAAFGRSGVVVSRARSSAHTVISENSPSSAAPAHSPAPRSRPRRAWPCLCRSRGRCRRHHRQADARRPGGTDDRATDCAWAWHVHGPGQEDPQLRRGHQDFGDQLIADSFVQQHQRVGAAGQAVRRGTVARQLSQVAAGFAVQDHG